MLNSIYTQLQPAFEEILQKFEDFFHEISTGIKSSNTGPIKSLLYMINFDEYLKKRLILLDKGYFLKVLSTSIGKDLNKIFLQLKNHLAEIKAISTSLTKEEIEVLSQNSHNSKSIKERLKDFTLIIKIFNDIECREKIINKDLKLLNNIENLLSSEDLKLDKISFSRTLKLIDNLIALSYVSAKMIYNYEIDKNTWEHFRKPIIRDENNIFNDYFKFPELYENNFDLYYERTKNKIIESLKKNPNKSDLKHNLKTLTTYKNLKDSYEIIKNLGFFKLIILKRFYKLDIKHFFGYNLNFILPVYIFHFAGSYKESQKINYFFSQTFYRKYIIVSILSFLILIAGNIISVIGLIIYVISQKISALLKDHFNMKVDIELPVKAGGLMILLLSLINSPYLNNLLGLSGANPIADILNQYTNNANKEKQVQTLEKDTIVGSNQFFVTLTGQNIFGIETKLNLIKDSIDNLKLNQNHISITSSQTSKNIEKTKDNEKIGQIITNKPYMLKRYETIYDVVNKKIDDTIEGNEREVLIRNVLKEYIKKNRSYLRQKVASNGYNPRYMDDFMLARHLPSNVRIDMEMIISLIKKYK